MTTTRSRIGLALTVVLLAGCASARARFEQLPDAEQAMFRRCQRPLAQHLCAGANEAAQSRCLRAQALTYARRSDKMRRRWLELNQCPAAAIDGPDEAVTAAQRPSPITEAAPAPTLSPPGAACHRSVECDSDLCVRGTCVALAMIEIGRPVQARAPSEPATTAVAAAAVPARDEESEPEPAPAPATTKKPLDVAVPLARLPAGPRLDSDGAADQLRGAIVAHQAEMKRCVERQLKLVPDLRAEGTLVLEVSASGRVTQAALRGERLEGTPLEGCMRTIAARWVFPRTSRGYAVEAPLEVSGVEGRGP
jgi:hypothetical protein